MRYDEVRDGLRKALREVGLFPEVEGTAVETIEIAHSIRRWKERIRTASPMERAPFHMGATVRYEWDPIEAARGDLGDEDALLHLLGDRQRYPVTGPRLLRVELRLRAILPFDSMTPIPAAPVLGLWAKVASERLDKVFTSLQDENGRVLSYTGGRRDGDISIKVNLGSNGELFLGGAAVKCFRYVRIPREWDERRLKQDEPADGELADLAARFKSGVDEWSQCVADLAKRIQYVSHRPVARPDQPLVEDDPLGQGDHSLI